MVLAESATHIYGRGGVLSRYRDMLRVGRSGDRVTVDARYSAPLQTDLDHPASSTMGTGSFPRVLRLGRGIDHPPISAAEVKEREQPYVYSTSEPSWPFLG